MKELGINPLILEKLSESVDDANILSFIEEVLKIEQNSEGNYGKIPAYEKVLAKYIRMKE